MINTPPTEWHPPQEKAISRGFKILIGLVISIGASIGVHMFVPTLTDAIQDIHNLIATTTSTLITGGILAVVVWLLYETFSKNGKINGLFAQAYSSFIHRMTLELLNVDPITPLTDNLRQVKARKARYDEQFARFDGTIQTLTQKEAQFRQSAAHAEQQAKAANTQGMTDAFKRAASKAGIDGQTADSFARMKAGLIPVRGVIVRLQSAANDIIYDLENQITATQAQWEMAKSMSALDREARGITLNSKTALAQEAQKLVDTQFATSLGRLNNLETAAQPLLESVDLDRATYSQALLDKWEQEANQNAIPVQATVVTPQVASASPYRSLIGGGS